jgi:very-short-patch-repair endonuclease
MTDAERKLWSQIRGHRLMGLRFRRQFPLGGYIADFACPEHRLIIEVDGSQHGEAEQRIYDAARTVRFERDGWTVVRFWNTDVLTHIDDVCEMIVRAIGTDKFR